MHPGAVGGVERDVTHAQQSLAVLRLRHRAVDHLEMFRAELAAGFFDQKNLAIDAAAHGVSLSVCLTIIDAAAAKKTCRRIRCALHEG
ncbi:hypothetical protein ACVJMY_000753 [Bradyrhizobium diazoefficiens]